MIDMTIVIVALLFFGILIIVHELGHFLSARLVGIYAEEFSIGMGPAIFKYSSRETQYSLRLLPIGGYVKFNEDVKSDDPRAFTNAKLWKRMLVIVSGSTMNFMLAISLLTVFFMSFGLYEVVPQVFEVNENTPAYNAGLLPQDVIVKVNDTKIDLETPQVGVTQIRQLIIEKKGQPIELNVLRNGEQITFKLTPKLDTETGNYRIGVVFGRIRRFDFFPAIGLSFAQTGRIIVMMVDMLGNMLTRGEGLGDVMGPVGIVGEIGRAVEYGVDRIMNLAIIISINLGIINLLPFPALDGGRFVIMLVEGLRGKPIDPKKEGFIHLIGFVLLMTLMVLITFRDIFR